MKIELKIIDDEVVGYDIIAETEEESLVMGNVRNLLFFGFDDTHIVYDGMETKDETQEGMRLVSKLKFIQSIHQKQ